MANVELRGVRKDYAGGVQAIKGIDCAIADGEFLVLLGPSGCGKSTLLRMVAGLETISSGEIEIGGRVVNQLEPKDRDIAMVFQNYALYPHMSVFDNMAYGLRIQGMPKDEITARVGEAAEMLELSPYLARKPRQLSGGQRQRVAMGRAIVRKPAVFLFDEPLSNLDAKLRTAMRVQIRKLQRELRVTSLYVTHDQVEAMTLADRMIVLQGGVAEQIGTPMEVYNRPATLFVAGFIGSPGMNILDGALVAGGRAVQLKGGPRLLLGDQPAGPEGLAVKIGIRPEHLHRHQQGSQEAYFVLGIDLVEQLGADTLAHGSIAGTPLVFRLPGTEPVRDGERLELGVLPENIHLFDAVSGKRL
jgi:sn-glycerol 3-phosphate transport system ATP-binding protein